MAGLDAGLICYSVSLRKRKLARKASAGSAVTFGWLAAERLWPTRASQGL